MIFPAPVRERSLATLRKTNLWRALGSSNYRKLSGAMRETFVKPVNEYLEPILPDIRTRCYCSAVPRIRPPRFNPTRMEKGISHAALVEIEHAGHYAFLDRPAHFGHIVRAFFEG